MIPAVKTVVALLILAGATPARSQSLQIVGQAGTLGEWDLTATVTAKDPSRSQDYAGPLTMTHVGMCTQEETEKKVGEIKFQTSRWTSRMTATLVIDGANCTFNGKFSDAFIGTLTCPDKRPVPLTLWVKNIPG